MISPAEFPYITAIHVNDCYTYQNFDIVLEKHQPFSHLILTGKNGSGKSTILKYINHHLDNAIEGGDNLKREIKYLIEAIEEIENSNTKERASLKRLELLEKELKEHERIQLSHIYEDLNFFNFSRKKIIYSFLLPNRNSKVNEVKTPTKQEEFEKQFEVDNTSTDFFIKNFKQYLVNKKVNQAFAQLDNNQEEIEATNKFFNNIEGIFSKIFEDRGLKLEFVKENYEFFIKLSDGRALTFDVLPDGFSAFLSILMDLFVRLDLIRKIVNNNTYDPCGIVLIDEPETHLHLSLQYQVLPILTQLFPNIQFIVATHSPAVISSIKNVTIFDLTSKEVLSDEAIGKSFSELMVSHFGLDNEFSDFTDQLFEQFNAILKEYRNNIPKRNEELKSLLDKNREYISPVVRFELEAKLSEEV